MHTHRTEVFLKDCHEYPPRREGKAYFGEYTCEKEKKRVKRESESLVKKLWCDTLEICKELGHVLRCQILAVWKMTHTHTHTLSLSLSLSLFRVYEWVFSRTQNT